MLSEPTPQRPSAAGSLSLQNTWKAVDDTGGLLNLITKIFN